MELLTDAEALHAKQHGWTLAPMFDSASKKWMLEIFPLDAKPVVVQRAKQRDPVAVRTLNLLLKSYHGGKNK